MGRQLHPVALGHGESWRSPAVVNISAFTRVPFAAIANLAESV
jgi:hypothetical protein